MNRSIAIITTVASSIYGFRAQLIKKLLAQNYTVYAFFSEYSPEDLPKIVDLGAIPITYSMNRGGVNPISDISATYELYKKLLDIKPYLVFSSFAKPIVFGTIAAKLARVPKVIGMLEGLGYSFTEQPDGISYKTKIIKFIQLFLYHISLPLADKIIFLNPDDPKDLVERYRIKVKDKIILGGIGVPLDEYVYQPVSQVAEPIRFLFIGRLLKEKGIFEFLEAAKYVKSKYPNTIFTVLGDVDPNNMGSVSKDFLESYIHNNIIDYPGQVNNVQDWIVKSHVFVLPSYREGVPRSTQEAMAIGRAIITTDVPGCRETVLNNVNGFLVERWNAEKIADRMIYFIQNTDKIIDMGYQSYVIASDKFDVEKVNNKLVDILGV